jgi:four helix bundle protein
MDNKNRSFEDLKIWQDGISNTVDLYTLFRTCKDYGMRDQIQRSSVSVPLNIAEYLDRQSDNEFVRFSKVAKGSLAELRPQLIIATKVDIIESQEELLKKTITLSAMIQKMMTYSESLNTKK